MVKISMDTFVKRFQPERYELWLAGKDMGCHPEDPSRVCAAPSPSEVDILCNKNNSDLPQAFVNAPKKGSRHPVYKRKMIDAAGGGSKKDEDLPDEVKKVIEDYEINESAADEQQWQVWEEIWLKTGEMDLKDTSIYGGSYLKKKKKKRKNPVGGKSLKCRSSGSQLQDSVERKAGEDTDGGKGDDGKDLVEKTDSAMILGTKRRRSSLRSVDSDKTDVGCVDGKKIKSRKMYPSGDSRTGSETAPDGWGNMPGNDDDLKTAGKSNRGKKKSEKKNSVLSDVKATLRDIVRRVDAKEKREKQMEAKMERERKSALRIREREQSRAKARERKIFDEQFLRDLAKEIKLAEENARKAREEEKSRLGDGGGSVHSKHKKSRKSKKHCRKHGDGSHCRKKRKKRSEEYVNFADTAEVAEEDPFAATTVEVDPLDISNGHDPGEDATPDEFRKTVKFDWIELPLKIKKETEITHDCLGLPSERKPSSDLTRRDALPVEAKERAATARPRQPKARKEVRPQTVLMKSAHKLMRSLPRHSWKSEASPDDSLKGWTQAEKSVLRSPAAPAKPATAGALQGLQVQKTPTHFIIRSGSQLSANQQPSNRVLSAFPSAVVNKSVSVVKSSYPNPEPGGGEKVTMTSGAVAAPTRTTVCPQIIRFPGTVKRDATAAATATLAAKPQEGRKWMVLNVRPGQKPLAISTQVPGKNVYRVVPEKQRSDDRTRVVTLSASRSSSISTASSLSSNYSSSGSNSSGSGRSSNPLYKSAPATNSLLVTQPRLGYVSVQPMQGIQVVRSDLLQPSKLRLDLRGSAAGSGSGSQAPRFSAPKIRFPALNLVASANVVRQEPRRSSSVFAASTTAAKPVSLLRTSLSVHSDGKDATATANLLDGHRVKLLDGRTGTAFAATVVRNRELEG